MKRYCPTLLSIIAIALIAQPLKAQDDNAATSAKNFFVCTTETRIPTLYIYKSGQTSLTPLISWHQEYLLPENSGQEICEQVAKKLQYLSQQPEPRYLTTEAKEEHTLVCASIVEQETCSTNYSEPLFAINPNYDANCVLDHREPLECVTVGLGRVRGVFTVPDSPYKPIWWLW